MPITIKERPEVFTEASINASDPPLLIRSSAVGLLAHELRRYCKREVAGRSFLIAGHRGAGKTTLVLNACQEVFKESRDGRFPLRPMLVMLQGPNLLPNEEDELPVAEDADKKDAVPKKISSMENVLRQITLGLYRALAREISQAFRDHARGAASRPETATGIPRGELIEFAAALELELDEYPGKSRLRQFWSTAGALETGVLWTRPVRTVSLYKRLVAFFTAVASDPDRTVSLRERIAAFFGSDTMLPVRPLDQGLRELVALCSACEAYRRISGTFTSKQEDTQGAKATEERKIEADLKGREILGPIMPVLVGALAGTGVLATNVANGPQAVFVGASAAIASAFALKYTSSRSRERSATREDLFIPDLSVATLDRVLPVLIDRLHAAGLAPIFVIDELDKVERLSTRIPEMVRRLKKLVSENAFFCFLTDRTYYEEMRERELKNPYSIEHTYFTHQLFIIFRHHDLHNFLHDVLEPPNLPLEFAQPFDPDSTAALEREAQNLIKLERDDCEVLPYVLLYAARMHSIDLRRELVRIRGEKDIVTLTAGAVQSGRRYGLELQMQVAIETLLDEEDMERELDRHPAFRRLAHDALYYLAERWEDANNPLDLSDNALPEFHKHLCSRMATDPPDKINASEPVPASHYATRELHREEKGLGDNDQSEGGLPTINDLDLHFLWTRVRDLAALLCSHDTLVNRARLRGTRTGPLTPGTIPSSFTPPPFPEVVLKAISRDSLLERLDDNEHRYRWRWYPAGRPVPVKRDVSVPETKSMSWKQHVEFIRAFKKELSNVTGNRVAFADLGTNLSIINTRPPWKNVDEAITRLETLASKGSYSGEQDDTATVEEFVTLLKRSAVTIAYALCAAKVLALWSWPDTSRPDAVTDMAQTLATISYGLSLQHASEESAAEWMKELFQQTCRVGADKPHPTPPSVDDRSGIESWGKWVHDMVRADSVVPVSMENLPDRLQGAWDYWYARLSGGSFEIVNVDSLICVQQRTGPGLYLTLPVEDMTVQAWSSAFCGALKIGLPKNVQQLPPPWLALAALSRLGFGDRVAHLRREDSKDIGRLFGNEKLPDAHLSEIRKWPIDHGESQTRSALVLGRGEPAMVGAWKPDLAFPLLTLSRPQGEALVTAERLGDLTREIYPDMVIFDLTPPQFARSDTKRSKANSQKLPPVDSIERVFWSMVHRRPLMSRGIPIVLPAKVPAPSPSYLYIINPKSSEDLFRQLAQQEEKPADQSQHMPSTAA